MFLLQCEKKDMRKNYMTTRRFKVSYQSWINRLYSPLLLVLCVDSIINAIQWAKWYLLFFFSLMLPVLFPWSSSILKLASTLSFACPGCSRWNLTRFIVFSKQTSVFQFPHSGKLWESFHINPKCCCTQKLYTDSPSYKGKGYFTIYIRFENCN